MAKDNNNAGMHFMRHTHKVPTADVDAYLYNQKVKERQAIQLAKSEELNLLDNPCVITDKDIDSITGINYDNGNIPDCSMHHYKILSAKKSSRSKLVIWVGYDIGGKNNETGELEPRGYYLYFTYHFARNQVGRKLLLFEVDRKYDHRLERAISIAKLYAKPIIKNYYPNLEIDWERPVYERFAAKSPWMFAERIRKFRTIRNCKLVF